MKKVSILVPESSVMQAIADPQYLFTAANQFLLSAGKQILFDVELVGTKKEIKLNGGMFSVHTDRLLKDVKKTDLVFIPALFGDMSSAISKNKIAIPWINEQYKKGAEVASLCVGAFLLASTGLLNGKKCSTHWGFQSEFREMFPDVEVVEGSIVTEEKRIYSSGGANSYWNLLLYLLEKYTDRQTAILASKYFAIDIDRDSQAAFAMFKGQKNHQDKEILIAQEYIEKNIHEKITTEELAKMASIGRRTFERRFKLATNNSVLEYIQRLKIEAAKRQFESSRKNINEVMFDVGYTDTKAFRDLFKKLTGLTPIEYRNKYNKMSMAAD
ncbi:MAG: helix-turn-helix domain-containing protein [Bacteroidetes bacterium]|nr:helix-turn-helix domain-containing protein [Bacteroidota bacterium]MBS1756358.1 helix-turn-helix domain-containing protein [Bacteroidota bacterium]